MVAETVRLGVIGSRIVRRIQHSTLNACAYSGEYVCIIETCNYVENRSLIMYIYSPE